MLAAVRSCGFVLLIVGSIAGPAGLAASADGGPCGQGGRPPCTILRPLDPGPDAQGPRRSGPECIVLVGGFGSDNDDTTFGDLIRWTEDEPLYRPVRFGDELGHEFPYDTSGAISRNALSLRSLVRWLGPDCLAIHIVTHSMGGAVADRAFSMGLSARDGVATYVPLSSPHNGATLAKALRAPIESDPVVAAETSILARSLGQPDPTSDAGHDLARVRPPRPIRDVASARLRLATDAMVLRRDTVDRRVEVREYLPEAPEQIEGHDGILHHETVRRVLATTIVTHQLAVDRRSGAERKVADEVSSAVDGTLAGIYHGLSRHLTEAPLRSKVELAVALALIEAGKAIAPAVREAITELAAASLSSVPALAQ